jgi:hypothetical protein
VADCVDALMDAMQPRGTHTVVDRREAQTERSQLRPGDDAMLGASEPGDPEVVGEFTAHIAV